MVQGRFRVRVEGPVAEAGGAKRTRTEALAASFEGDIVREATPNPRTLAFRTGPVSDAASRQYRSAADTDDPRVARLFEVLPDLISVACGPGLGRPDLAPPGPVGGPLGAGPRRAQRGVLRPSRCCARRAHRAGHASDARRRAGSGRSS